ncbi:hypothetical protein RSOL_328120, partial [Rhizoctonia solani AG-3 Rhs1AP]
MENTRMETDEDAGTTSLDERELVNMRSLHQSMHKPGQDWADMTNRLPSPTFGDEEEGNKTMVLDAQTVWATEKEKQKDAGHPSTFPAPSFAPTFPKDLNGSTKAYEWFQAFDTLERESIIIGTTYGYENVMITFINHIEKVVQYGFALYLHKTLGIGEGKVDELAEKWSVRVYPTNTTKSGNVWTGQLLYIIIRDAKTEECTPETVAIANAFEKSKKLRVIFARETPYLFRRAKPLLDMPTNDLQININNVPGPKDTIKKVQETIEKWLKTMKAETSIVQACKRYKSNSSRWTIIVHFSNPEEIKEVEHGLRPNNKHFRKLQEFFGPGGTALHVKTDISFPPKCLGCKAIAHRFDECTFKSLKTQWEKRNPNQETREESEEDD